MSSLDTAADGLWRSPLRSNVAYRLCANYVQQTLQPRDEPSLCARAHAPYDLIE